MKMKFVIGFVGGCALAAFAEGDFTESLVLAGGEARVLESGSYGSIEGDGTIIARGDIAYGSIAPTVNVIVEDGVKVSSLYTDAYAQAVMEKAGLWLDASDDASMKEYTYNGHTVPEGTFPGIVVRRWSDCRKEFLTDEYNYALNAREDGFIRVMPYTVPNALNGRTVVSFGTYPGSHLENNDPRNQIDSSGKPTGNGYDEQRRLIFSKPVSCATAIMVFGSQNAGPKDAPVGGGTALLGGWTQSTNSESKNLESGELVAMVGDTQAPFPRNSTTAKILDENLPCWVDGEQVNPKETDLNGSYQIISLSPNEARDVRSLGMKFSGANAGGQIYGEVLIFTNKLDFVERIAVERYLAKKWGLMDGQRVSLPKSLTLGTGSVFESDGVGSLKPDGAGALQLSGRVIGEGAFSGSVKLAEGASLELREPVAGWTQDQVAAVANRVGWFDPDCAEDLTTHTKTVDGIDHAFVDALFDHGNKSVAGTPYLHGYYRAHDNNDRSPSLLLRPVPGTDMSRNWLDFYSDLGEKNGNNLRVQTDHGKAVGDQSDVKPIACKTVFIVMDSCYGGCSPIIDNVSGNSKNQPQTDGSTLVRPRAYNDYRSPIWGAGTTEALTNGETRLNGVAVDGTKTGFTGGPELFSFTTDGTDFRASYFANYNARNQGSYAVLGEILLYSTVLDDATRSGIESYLMEKWLGKADWTRATVSGSGTVKATGPAAVPGFASDFNGTLEMDATTLNFVFDGATRTVEHQMSVPGTLKLAPAGTVVVHFKNGEIKDGIYTLATFGTLAEPGIADWTVAEVRPTYKTILYLEDNAIKVRVASRGMTISVR